MRMATSKAWVERVSGCCSLRLSEREEQPSAESLKEELQSAGIVKVKNRKDIKRSDEDVRCEYSCLCDCDRHSTCDLTFV